MRNTKAEKAHREYMELENIVEEMGEAMRRAYLPYIGESGRMTPGQQGAWNRYIAYAFVKSGLSIAPCKECGRSRTVPKA